MVGRSVATLVVVVLLAVGVLAAPINASPLHATSQTPATATDSIYVAATGDYGYSQYEFNDTPTHATITVTFVDNSSMPEGHSFTILGVEGVQIPNTDTQAQIDSLAFGNHPPALFNLNVTPSSPRNTSSFQSPGPGWYEFVCTLPSHFQEGMYGFIAFGMNVPSNVTLPPIRVTVGSSNLTFSPIDAAILGVLVVVFILGYVVWRRRRAPPRTSRDPVGRARTVSSGDQGARPGR
ncbi:MAG: cupredoxin domain-containing protein [Thermoplasmata archaeon]